MRSIGDLLGETLSAEERAIANGTAAPDDKTTGRGLMPIHHPNRDFFLCDLFDYALKDDGVSMEAPIFTLATKRDTNVWRWQSRDGKRSVEVTPSVKGRATQFDKDLLIYVVSQMTDALNRKRPDAHRTRRHGDAHAHGHCRRGAERCH